MSTWWFGNVVALSVALVGAAGDVVCGQDSAPAVTDLRVFVGTWKENQSKSRSFISSTLTYTFTADPDGFINIVRGGVQLRERVRMDGQDYPTPGFKGRTASWVKVNDLLYESTIKRDGTLIAAGKWMLSDAGRQLTQETTPVRANGEKDISIIQYERISGHGDTLLGKWKPVSARSAVPDLFRITLRDDELSVFYPKYGATLYTMRLDGKRYPLAAPNTLPGMTTVAQALATRSLRRTTFRADSPTLEIVMTVSADGNTMTVTTHAPNSSDEPSVFVYEKQE